ncbi:hypothetical protein ABT263_30300 [Kitasatospora sp. NPDC001603]|uniref:hypothetical protein n=1 Tax=Kitasatospora sp. NPDC001603 TaxID=3154388 RepID=UPI00331E4020
MSLSTRTRTRALALTAGAAVLALALTACGSAATGGTGGTGGTGRADGMTGGHGMAGMDHGAASATATTAAPAAGAPAAERNGYRLTSAVDTLPAGAPAEYRFTVTGPDGAPVTAYETDQTKRMHFYAIRSDLTGFQHLHPEMAADGTWTAPLAAPAAGTWRVYASFVPDSGAGKGAGLVLSRTVDVPGEGAAAAAPLPAATGSTTVDGYTVTVEGAPAAGRAGELKVTVARDDRPVTDLQPYLETFAHLTAFHAGDQAFAHLHPQARAEAGSTGGPTLSFHAELPTGGDWRLFLQFMTGGTLHTAALTLRVG